jgi:hypothetical protein
MLTQVQTHKVSSALPTYARYWVGTVIAPRQTLAQIGQEHSSQPGFFAALLYAYLYLITELVLVIRDLPLSSPPSCRSRRKSITSGSSSLRWR